LLFVLIAFNCSNLKRNDTNTHSKNHTSHNEDLKICDNMKHEFSNISAKLTKFEEEAKAEFSKKMTVDQEEKLMKTLGSKIEHIGHLADHLHRKFKHLAMSGKLNKETIEAVKEKFQGMKKKFEMIEKMGEEKMEELKKKKPDTKVDSFVQISHKKNQTIEEEDEEGNMERIKGAVSEILNNLTNFEIEAEKKFQEKNMTIDHEEKIMKYLGKDLGKIERAARHLHSEFEHMAKSGKEGQEDIKAMAEQFQQVQEKFELIFQMGDDKMKEIQETRRNISGKNETRHERPHKRERRPENEKNETRPERPEKPGKFDHKRGKGKGPKNFDHRKGQGKEPKIFGHRRNRKENSDKNETKHEDNLNGLEKLREEFSGVFQDLSKLKKHAKEEFTEKKVTKAEQEKIINFIGKKMGKIGATMRRVQHHFEKLKRSGKLNKEEIHNIFKKFHQVNEFFGEIAHMGDDQKAKSEPEKFKKNQNMNKKEKQEEHSNGMKRPPMGLGKHNFGGMVRPTMGKHARPPGKKSQRKRTKRI